MVNRLKLILDPTEYSALVKIALDELRTPADQARHMLRQELTRRGVLAAEASEAVLTPGIPEQRQDE